MTDVYRIGVSLMMTSNVSQVMQVMSRDILGVHAQVEKLEGAFGRLGRAIMGGLAIAGGAGILGTLKDVANHGDKLLDQQDKLRRAGVAMNDVLRMQGDYYERVAKAVPTSTVAEYLKEVGELRSVVGQARAEEVAPWSMKLEAIIRNSTGKNTQGEGFKLWRSLEMGGWTISNPDLAMRIGESFAKNIVGSQGKLSANDYQTMARRGGVAWSNADPRFLAGPMSVVAADLGGETAGTAMMSAYMFMTGANTMSKQQYEVMKKAGLIDPEKVTVDKGGRVNVGPGGIVGSDKFTGEGKFDLFGWVNTVMAPALQKLSGGDRSVFDSFVAKIGRNRNVMRMLNMFSDPKFLEQIEKDMQTWDQAASVDKGYGGLTTSNSKGTKEAFWKQWESMMESIGAPIMQAALPVMQEMTKFFTNIGAWANAHGDAIRRIGEGFALLGGSLVVGGIIALASAIGPFALAAGALTAVGVAIAGFTAIHWPEVKAAVKTGIDGIVQVFMGLGEKIQSAATAIRSAVDAVVNALSGIAGAIQSAVSNILHWTPGAPGAAPVPGAGRGNPGSNKGVVPEAPTPKGGVGRQSYDAVPPPPGGRQVAVAGDVYLDGRKVGRHVARSIVADSSWPSSSSDFDGRMMPSPTDIG